MTDLKNINLEECLELLKRKKISSKELVSFYLKEAESNKELNAYISLNSENAIKSAEESDKRIASNTTRPLEGVPLAIKDLFCTKDVLTTAASKMLNNFIPTYETTVTQKLWDAGTLPTTLHAPGSNVIQPLKSLPLNRPNQPAASGTLGTGLPETVCARPVLAAIASRKSRIKLCLRNAISLHRTAGDYKRNGLCMTTVIMPLAAFD